MTAHVCTTLLPINTSYNLREQRKSSENLINISKACFHLRDEMMQRCSFIALLEALFSVDGYNAFFFTYLHRQQKVAEELDSHLLKQSKASTPGNLYPR